MTSTPVQSDLTLWHTLRTRRRHVEPLKGIDAMAGRWRARLKHARVGMPYLRREAETIVAMGDQWATMADRVLDDKIASLREIFARRNHDQEHLRVGMAAIREVVRRETGEQPYRVQIMGALGLFHGQIVEMLTGEGKTLTGSIAATMLAWLRRPVHVITVNDYLAERDAESRQSIYRRCGVSAASIVGDVPPPKRRQMYRSPIIYVTQKELVADWLRDQLALGRLADPVTMRWRLGGPKGVGRPHPSDQVLVPGLHMAILDEVDSLLIDEAVTPLIIAQPRGDEAHAAMYKRARDLAQDLTIDEHYRVELKKRRVKLTARGQEQVESLLKPKEHAIWRAVRRREELVEQALVAKHCYQHGQHYQMVEDRVMIVDEFTGRIMPDRQWQHGLHQAVEAKHDLEITADRDTLASLSFQRFFMLYPHLCGMTGTAASAKPELETTYTLPVRIVPTNRPCIRIQWPEQVYLTAEGKWQAVVDEITKLHRQGRPILVGTRSVNDSEHVSSLLKDLGLEHQVLNAVNHRAEAQIIAQAGQSGAITVATNMAGRGTDIKLGKGVAKRGGLHVMLTERHTAERIDRQLFGRTARQGDPGTARAFICLEDELVVKFTPKLTAVLKKRFAGRLAPLPRWTRRVFNLAQRQAERLSFKSRHNILKHDEELDRALPR